ISDKLKVYNELNLIYVGTLNNRNIDRLVLGVIEYCKRNNAKYPDIKLTIIGDGYGSELQELHELVENNKLEDTISILGRIPHDRLKPYFDSHNIGVSYIPITKYYDNQPPTKTFEYLTSGMLVLATGTSENINVIDNSNGVIIGDSPEDVCRGIEVLSQNLKHYSSEAIIENSKKYSWSKIIKDFDYYLEQITNPKMSHNSN
ncbi:MAG: glycosyltransferase, partial [Sulfurimonas sp.]